MNKSTLHKMFGRKTKIQIFRSTRFSALVRWTSLLTILIVPAVVRGGQLWNATVGAQSNDKGRQALTFLPNEIWIHAGDSIKWQFDADDVHTVTFLNATDKRPDFSVGPPNGFSSGSATFDGTISVSTPPLVKGQTFMVTFPTAGNFKLVCLVHERMTGAVHVLEPAQQLPHPQDFYDRQAADQRQDLLSDRDECVDACHPQKRDHAAHHSIDAHLVIAGIGEISATAGGSQTLSVVRFKDDKIEIHAGQTVEWNNHDPVTPHTITFGTEPLNPVLPSSNVNEDADGALHATINSSTDNVNSGLIVAPSQERLGLEQSPLGFTRFRVTFQNPGVFPYVCALHDNLGMKGTVIVYP